MAVSFVKKAFLKIKIKHFWNGNALEKKAFSLWWILTEDKACKNQKFEIRFVSVPTSAFARDEAQIRGEYKVIFRINGKGVHVNV